ncbi:MAG: phytanoyl-CoA dioxygenase family protein [Sphingobacteriales bacterium]|nr:MAG: phytanoyl-CoA dioxygenase family protein [Sphingobacteriales bacterium]
MQNLKERFETEGYVLLPGVLDDELMAETRQHLDWLGKKFPEIATDNYQTVSMPVDPFWVRLVSDDRLLDIVEQFLGPNIALFGAHYFAKPPFEGRAVLWHQDGSYWPLDPVEIATLWLAVDDVDPENGCLRVIPGSHNLELQEMQSRNDVPNILNSAIDQAFVDESKAVDCTLKAGGVEAHHPNTIHGSEANNSPRRRAGLAIRYIPTSTRITQTPWAGCYLLRGEAVEGINTYEPLPRYIEGEHMPFKGCEDWI